MAIPGNFHCSFRSFISTTRDSIGHWAIGGIRFDSCFLFLLIPNNYTTSTLRKDQQFVAYSSQKIVTLLAACLPLLGAIFFLHGTNKQEEILCCLSVIILPLLSCFFFLMIIIMLLSSSSSEYNIFYFIFQTFSHFSSSLDIWRRCMENSKRTSGGKRVHQSFGEAETSETLSTRNGM